MRIVKQTSTNLIIKSSDKTRLLLLGVALFIVGLLVVALSLDPVALGLNQRLGLNVGLGLIGQEDFALPDLYRQFDEDTNPEELLEQLTQGEIGIELAYHAGRALVSRRSFLFLGVFGLIVGVIILLGPNRNQKFTLDKSQQQMKVKRPRWFFRASTAVYSLQDVSNVRVERDRMARSKKKHRYRVHLVANHSEGVPLTPNYVQYVELLPLSEAYRYDQKEAQDIADRIRAFLQNSEKRD
jgi:hypothetical protein